MLRRFSRLLLGVFSLIVLCVISVTLLQNRFTLDTLRHATSNADPDMSQSTQQTSSYEQFLSYRRIG